MTKTAFSAVCAFRTAFKSRVEQWNAALESAAALTLLRQLQQKAAAEAHTPPYPLETPIVYNTALDKIDAETDIKLIVVGDNPGKKEQLFANRAYLVGQAGTLAEGFFRAHPSLNVDFRKNALILNKTPVHSAKTNQLRLIQKEAARIGGTAADALCHVLTESQTWMASQTAALHAALMREDAACALMITGYGELGDKKLFAPYRDTLRAFYAAHPAEAQNVLVFQHFSMNRFSIDFNKHCAAPTVDCASALRSLGAKHRREIFGF